MARLAIVLPVVAGELAEGDAADGGNAVITLLPMNRLMDIAHLRQGLGRELALLALDLLQTEHVGRLFAQDAFDLGKTQADGIDVPGGDREHGGGIGSAAGRRKPTCNKKPSCRGHWHEGSMLAFVTLVQGDILLRGQGNRGETRLAPPCALQDKTGGLACQ
ncbi:hypothetical protein D2V04_15790 [Pelagerythrobacter aerophilus]|uniref:Uncharacterized protein n=1 Tax=Pelagerythrobacter aerophilus TaxID=2306995 RepID=A0A418NDC7_9SPHN|nr:hypothetical protein D2V04_15790 [Pelagerythrobacter aerophilus]